jgi:hypothetical protein
VPSSKVLGAPQFLRDRARQNWVGTFPDLATVYRIHNQATTPDFGHTTTWLLLGPYPASYWSITGQEALILGQLNVEGSITLRLPYGADITEKDQVIYHVTESGATIHMEVTAVHDRTQAQDTHVTCIELKFLTPVMTVG